MRENQILFINACVRPESRTLQLARRVLEKLEGRVEEINLEREALSPMTLPLLEKRDNLLRERSFSDPMFRYARQYAGADEIVIAAPFWDMSFPAALKIFYENIMVLGICFSYTPEGIPKGMCKAGRAIYVTTAGGPLPEHNSGLEYVRTLNETFLGIPETVSFSADKLDIVGADTEQIMGKALEEIDKSPLWACL